MGNVQPEKWCSHVFSVDVLHCLDEIRVVAHDDDIKPAAPGSSPFRTSETAAGSRHCRSQRTLGAGATTFWVSMVK